MSSTSLDTETRDASSTDGQTSFQTQVTLAANTKTLAAENDTIRGKECNSVAIQVCPGKRNARIQARPRNVSIGKFDTCECGRVIKS